MQLSLDLFRAKSALRARPQPVLRAAAPEIPPAPDILPAAQTLKSQIAKLDRSDPLADWGVAPFGDARLDAHLPGGGLPRGRWHEIGGEGFEREAPAAMTGFAAALAAHVAGEGVVLWALQRDDAYAPGLQSFGLDPDRVIFVRARNDDELLAVCEDGLRTRGVCAVIGEAAELSLIAGKRLQLACERGGASAFMLRRRLYGAPRKGAAPQASAAVTRWRIAPAPSETDLPGLGAPRWRAALTRCRGGRPGAWILESQDGTGENKSALRVAAELADHAAEAQPGRGLSGGRTGPGAGAAGSQYAAALRGR